MISLQHLCKDIFESPGRGKVASPLLTMSVKHLVVRDCTLERQIDAGMKKPLRRG